MKEIVYEDSNIYGKFVLYKDHLEFNYKALGMGKAEEYNIKYKEIKSFEFINSGTIPYKFLHIELISGETFNFYIKKKMVEEWEQHLNSLLNKKKQNTSSKEEITQEIDSKDKSSTIYVDNKFGKNNKGLIVVVVCIVFVVAFYLISSGGSSDKTKLQDYLIANGYTEDSRGCYVNSITDEDGNTQNVKYCLSECKYYASLESMYDSFELDMRNNDVEYTYSGVQYTYNGTTKEYGCSFDNSSLYSNSSRKTYYCSLVSKLATKLAKPYFETTNDGAWITVSKFCN